MQSYLIYIGEILALTLGVVIVCGLAAWLARKAFVYLVGGRATFVLYASSVIGTPVHELGHALMCIPFAHRITDIKLLLPPSRRSRTLGYVEHSHNRKNPWAVFGNLFISFGPIFSGLAVTILALYLCFPVQWSTYLESSRQLVASGGSTSEVVAMIFSLLFSLPEGFGQDAFRATIGIIIILSVAQHITLSFADLRGCASALLMYTAVVAVFAVATMLLGKSGIIISALATFNLQLLSLFSVSIAFSLAWVIIAVLVYLFCRKR